MSDNTLPHRGIKPSRTQKQAVKLPKLAVHPNGQFYTTKRINGRKKFFYFGKDREQATKEYLKAVGDLVNGRQPATTIEPDTMTVVELVDRFITAQEERYRANDIGIRQFDDLRRAANLFADWARDDTPVVRLPNLDSFRTWIKKRYKLNSFNRHITGVKKMFRWAFKLKPQPLVRIALHEDDALRKAAKKQLRREKRETETENGKAMYSPIEYRALLLHATTHRDWQFVAHLLLAGNAGMGQSHIGDLPNAESIVQIHREGGRIVGGYVDWVRTKTEEICQFPLWPITAEAIERCRASRAKPRQPEFAGLLFLTVQGNAWVREYFEESRDGVIGKVAPNDEIGKRHDTIERMITLNGMPLKRAGRRFYAIRRTFSTIADEQLDGNAKKRIMGHSLGGMDPHYVLSVPIERLLAVTNHVHKRLLTYEPNELTLDTLAAKLALLLKPCVDTEGRTRVCEPACPPPPSTRE